MRGSPPKLQVLVVEDSPDDAELMIHALRHLKWEVAWRRVETETAYLTQLEEPVDLILADFTLPQFGALRALELLKERGPNIPFIVVSGSIGEDVAVTLLQRGADDYLLKDRLGRLGEAVRGALHRRELEREKQRALEALRESEARFRRLAENAPDVIYRYRLAPDPGFDYVSAAVKNITGYSPQEFYDDPALGGPLIYPGDRQLPHVAKQPFLTQWQRANGTISWTEQRNVLVRDEEGNPVAIEGVARDVTERQQRQREQEAIASIASALRAATTRDEMLPIVLEQACTLLQAKSAALMMRDSARDVLVVELAHGAWRQATGWSLPPAVGITGHVLATGQPYVTENVRSDSLFSQTELLKSVEPNGPAVYVPFVAQGESLGVLAAGRPLPFAPEEVQLLTAIADIGASALHRASLLEQTERRLQRLVALHDIGHAINSNPELQVTLDVVLEQVVRQLRVDAAAVLLLNDDRQLVHAADVGFRTGEITQTKVALDEGRVGRAAAERRMIFISELAAVGSAFARHQLVAREKFISYYAVPLLAKEEVKGVLEIFHRERLQRDVEWENFVELLAGQAAVALDNADLFSQTRRLLHQTERQARQVRQIMDAVPEGILLLDAQHQLVLANPAAETILATLVGDDWEGVVSHLGKRPLAELLEPPTEDFPWHELRLSQTEQVFEVAARPVGEQAQVEGWVLVLRDVTEERRQQQYLYKQERLATVGQLAAGIAHDFNNIMSVITLYGEALVRLPEHPRREKYLDTIVEQARHAADLIGQILDFSRASVLDRSRMDLVLFVGDTVELLRRTLPENINISFSSDQEDYFVEADPTRLQQVLMNLAVNARDAMPRGGELSIDLSALTLAPGQRPPLPAMEAGTWVCLAISDTGIGIPPDVLAHIFEPFFTTKEQGRGTGLGLAQVHGIVKQHGGEINVESQTGEGTTFTIYLPALELPQSANPLQNDRLSASGSGQMLLLVEDSRPTLEALAETLEDLNYLVLTATDGEEALRLFSEYADEIELVISDLVMPAMGGAELHARLREIKPDISIVVMSGHPLKDYDNRLLSANEVDAWLEKPFAVSDFAQTVKKVLGK